MANRYSLPVKTGRALVGLVFLSAILGDYGLAESPGPEDLETLRAQIQVLQEGQARIQKELEEIKELLQASRLPPQETLPDLVLSLKGNPFKGSPTAPLTLVEFSDYQCPFCGRHFRETLPQIERDYIATGKVKYVFRNFPITSIHKQAFKAAEAANCAGEQNKYWEMHDQLFAHQKALDENEFTVYVQAAGLNPASFHRCLESGSQAAQIRIDISEGQKAGVKGTPAFFIGSTNAQASTVKVMKILQGAKPYRVFKETLEGLLTGLPK